MKQETNIWESMKSKVGSLKRLMEMTHLEISMSKRRKAKINDIRNGKERDL